MSARTSTERFRMHPLAAEMLAEFAGTMILILFGVGVVAQVVAGGLGNHDSIAWAWGLGVTLGVYTAARTSGAHLNPAVTIALAVFKGFSWAKVVPYAIAQFLGAFVAALIVRWNYSEVLNKLDPDHSVKSQGIFSTLPGNGVVGTVQLGGAFRDQIIGTAILLFGILAIVDVRNTAPIANLGPFIIGLLIVAIGMAWGTDAGYAINPARDFGPRLASYLTGFSNAFNDQYNEAYWYVPIVAPILGGIIGAGLYEVLIGRWLPPIDEPQETGRVPGAEDIAAAEARV